MENPTVIVAEPDPDGAAGAVLAARGCGSTCETLFIPSAELLEFFDPPTQRELPHVYSLVLVGLGLVHSSWDGELLRPYLVQALRGLASPVRWFSARTWDSDDRAVVENIVGEGRLVVDPAAASSAELVHQYYTDPDSEYADALLQLARDEDQTSPDWVAGWRRVISSLKDSPARISETIQPLLNGEPEPIPQELLDRTERIERTNRDLASENAGDPVPMRDYTLTRIDIPPEQHAYWREISSYARASRGTDFALCHLLTRPVLVLSRGDEHRIDLRRWIRYVTDVVPAATAVEPRPDAVPLFVENLTDDPGLADEVVRALRDGSHLLDD